MKTYINTLQQNRRKLLYWTAGVFSGLLLWRFKKPEPTEKPVKMLTEDGQLVEVDPRYLGHTRHKINHKEMQTWIKRKS